MSWHPNDLLDDTDLVAYEKTILTQYGATDWQSRRTKALEDWLFPILKGRGFNPQLVRTRYECDAVFGYTAAAYTDLLGASRSTTEDDINLATVFATPASDALYIGSKSPFCGVFFRLLDSVSSATGTITVKYWGGAWDTLTATDHTLVAGKTLDSGGSVRWTLPTDWQIRTLNNSDAMYWVKVTLGATPTAAKATQIGTIRASSLRAPVTFRTLQLIFREAPTGQDGPWTEKADFYKAEADDALQRALVLVAGEFDTDNSDLVSETEAEQTSDQLTGDGGGWVLERY